MKSALLIIFLSILNLPLQSQTSRFNYGVEYSPNFSGLTGPIFEFEDLLIAHNVFIKGGYGINKHVNLTVGLGYLNTKEFDVVHLNGFLDIDSIESKRNYNHLVVPIGLKFSFGSFYFNPEIGVGWNFRNKTKQVSYLTNGMTVTDSFDDEYNSRKLNKVTAPVFLTVGSQIDLHSCSILLGIKGYYSLSAFKEDFSLHSHYFGLGILMGVQF